MSRSFVSFASALCLFAIATTVHAKSPTCDQIDAAISANEDFVEVALSGDKSKLDEAHKSIRTNFDALKSSLSGAAVKAAEGHIKAVDQAMAANDMATASVSAIENYAVLADAFQKRLPTSLPAAMLDYAGFRLHGLSAAKTIDWAKVETTVGQSMANAKAAGISPDDKALNDLMGHINAGLAGAVKSKDKPWLDSTAQILLDSVDLVEKVVKNGAKGACK